MAGELKADTATEATTTIEATAPDALNEIEQALLESEGYFGADKSDGDSDEAHAAVSAAEGNAAGTDSSAAEQELKSPEAAPEAQPEAEAEAEADLAGLGTRAQKRILELLGRSKAAEARAEAAARELETLKAEVGKLQQAAPQQGQQQQAQPPADPLAPSLADAQGFAAQMQTPTAQRIAELERVVDLAEAHPDGLEVDDGKGGKRFIPPEEVRAARAATERELRTLVAQDAVARQRAAESYAQTQARFAQIAAVEYPFLKDTAAPEHQLAREILRSAPEIKRFANWPVAVGILARGLTDFQAKMTAAGAAGGGAAPNASPNHTAATAQPGGATPGTGAARQPRAPQVGAGVSGGAPRSAGAAGVRRQEQAVRGLAEAALRGDVEAEEAALAAFL